VTAGAVAAGSPLTVEAGLTALKAGGNAVDAAIAASLMACVAEPLLTGLGGAGLAMIRFGEEVTCCDLFTNAPGLGRGAQQTPEPMTTVMLDFGPTTQRFHVGASSVAPPGIPAGLWAMHAQYARLPMPVLAAPAVRAAREGYEVPMGFERVGELLWAIQELSEESSRLFGPGGKRPWRAGDHFQCADLGDSIERYATAGPRWFQDGEMAQKLLRAVAGGGAITPEDLAAYTPVMRRALHSRYRGADIWVPGPPSVGGILVLHALEILERGGLMPAALTADEVRRIGRAMQQVETTRDENFYGWLVQDGNAESFVEALRSPGSQPGHTTHISVIDESQNMVSITTSLGETAGLCIPGTGLSLNNFLGEEDVNPPHAPRPPGERLYTMCSPTLLRHGNHHYALGSGGSSRIRSAILHGAVYLLDHGMHPSAAVQAPRAHVEFGHLHVETDGRPAACMDALASASPLPVRSFEGANMFFGGLHIAGAVNGSFVGAGDPRRSGSFGSA
jgi:gamma-glutamyltranspeptidase/glutathione hydrolase